MKKSLQSKYEKILKAAEGLQKELARLRRREKHILTEVPSLKGKKNAVDQAVKTGGPAPPGTEWDDPLWIDEIRDWQVSLHVPQTYYSPVEKRAMPELEKIWSDIKAAEERLLQRKDEKESLLVDAAIAEIKIARDETTEKRLGLQALSMRPEGGPIRQSIQESGVPVEPAKLEHSPDYISVTLHHRNFTLTPQQAQVIKILHQAHEKQLPDVSQAHILEEIETTSRRLSDTFKSNPEAYRWLVASGKRRGTYRLKV